MSDASVNIEYSPNKIRCMLGLDAKLADMSFAIESTVNYFFGRSVYRWSLERGHLPQKRFIITANALCIPTEMLLSQVAPVEYAVKSGVLPRKFKEHELWDRTGNSSSDKWLPDGQHRLVNTFQEGDFTVSIVHTKQLIPSMPLGHLSYGLADMISGFFYRGVKFVKWQGSYSDTQLYIRHHMSHDEIREYLQSKESDYDLEMTLGDWLSKEQS